MNKISILEYWQMSNSINHSHTMICPYMTDLKTYKSTAPIRMKALWGTHFHQWANGHLYHMLKLAKIITKYLMNISAELLVYGTASFK